MSPITRLQGGGPTFGAVIGPVLSPSYGPAGSDVTGFIELDVNGSQVFLNVGDGMFLAVEAKQ